MASEDARIGFSKEQVLLGTYDNSGTDEARRVAVDADGKVITSSTATIVAGDLEIGAVEIKNATTDDRATVNASGELFVKDGGGLGSLTETAPATDTASSGINGRLQRIAQRLTSLIALLPTALGNGGGLKTSMVGNEAGTATHTADNTVTNASETILASNASRKAAYVQVVSGGNARVTIDGVDATTTLGIQVSAGGAPLVLQAPFCPTAAIKAIREGTTDAVIQVVEIV